MIGCLFFAPLSAGLLLGYAVGTGGSPLEGYPDVQDAARGDFAGELMIIAIFPLAAAAGMMYCGYKSGLRIDGTPKPPARPKQKGRREFR